MSNDPEKTEPMKFSGVLVEHAHGSIDDELTMALRDVAGAAIATQRDGSITLVVKVKPSSSRTVALTCDVKKKVPVTPETNVFYVDRTGDLTREDPYQDALPFTQINPSGAGARVVHIAETGADGQPVAVDPETGAIRRAPDQPAPRRADDPNNQ